MINDLFFRSHATQCRLDSARFLRPCNTAQIRSSRGLRSNSERVTVENHVERSKDAIRLYTFYYLNNVGMAVKKNKIRLNDTRGTIGRVYVLLRTQCYFVRMHYNSASKDRRIAEGSSVVVVTIASLRRTAKYARGKKKKCKINL